MCVSFYRREKKWDETGNSTDLIGNVLPRNRMGSIFLQEKKWKCSAYKCKDFPGRDFPGRDFHARDLKGQHSSLACSSMFCGLCKRSWDILLPRHRTKGSYFHKLQKSSFRFTKRYSAVRVCLCRIAPKKERSGRSHFFRDGSPEQITGGVWVYS